MIYKIVGYTLRTHIRNFAVLHASKTLLFKIFSILCILWGQDGDEEYLYFWSHMWIWCCSILIEFCIDFLHLDFFFVKIDPPDKKKGPPFLKNKRPSIIMYLSTCPFVQMQTPISHQYHHISDFSLLVFSLNCQQKRIKKTYKIIIYFSSLSKK